MIGPGIWITGPSRSGTSLVAGLFAAHGVFFGDTVEADEHNEKGYFEHRLIVDRVETSNIDGWPEIWWNTLEDNGFRSGWWAVKRGPRAWPWVEMLRPHLIVICKRPVKQIARSRLRRWPGRNDPAVSIDTAKRQLADIAREATCPVVTVDTNRLVRGDYRKIRKAFTAVGLWFHEDTARTWIDPGIWNRGP